MNLREVIFAEHVDVERERPSSYSSDINLKQIQGICLLTVQRETCFMIDLAQ
jgi:hypothetical protein